MRGLILVLSQFYTIDFGEVTSVLLVCRFRSEIGSWARLLIEDKESISNWMNFLSYLCTRLFWESARTLRHRGEVLNKVFISEGKGFDYSNAAVSPPPMWRCWSPPGYANTKAIELNLYIPIGSFAHFEFDLLRSRAAPGGCGNLSFSFEPLQVSALSTCKSCCVKDEWSNFFKEKTKHYFKTQYISSNIPLNDIFIHITAVCIMVALRGPKEGWVLIVLDWVL